MGKFKMFLTEANSSKLAKDIFGDTKHGKELAKIFGNKADRKKFDKYIDKIENDNDLAKATRIIENMMTKLFIDTRLYQNKPMKDSVNALWNKIELLYKVFTDKKENVNEAKKSKSASKVLQLMDKYEDGADRYMEFVKKIAKEDNISVKQLEKELDPFI